MRTNLRPVGEERKGDTNPVWQINIWQWDDPDRLPWNEPERLGLLCDEVVDLVPEARVRPSPGMAEAECQGDLTVVTTFLVDAVQYLKGQVESLRAQLDAHAADKGSHK